MTPIIWITCNHGARAINYEANIRSPLDFYKSCIRECLNMSYILCCTNIRTYVPTHRYTTRHTQSHTPRCTYTCTHQHRYTHINTHTHQYTCMESCTRNNMHGHWNIFTYIYAHTYALARTHAYPHRVNTQSCEGSGTGKPGRMLAYYIDCSK